MGKRPGGRLVGSGPRSLINTSLGAQKLSCFLTATTVAKPQVRGRKLYALPEICVRCRTGATPFNEPGFMGDNNGAMTASFSTSGFGVGLNDGTPRSFRIPCSTGAY
ncbi:MAG TPA: hypothetical protein VHN80_28640, partial [Kineosporiaceae bacterium]|nr:hypothetical protein [Kineosporiaceae bacterium]